MYEQKNFLQTKNFNKTLKTGPRKIKILAIANIRKEPTFFMIEKESDIDVSFEKLLGWKVWTYVENLNDHHHIKFSYSDRIAISDSSTRHVSGMRLHFEENDL